MLYIEDICADADRPTDRPQLWGNLCTHEIEEEETQNFVEPRLSRRPWYPLEMLSAQCSIDTCAELQSLATLCNLYVSVSVLFLDHCPPNSVGCWVVFINFSVYPTQDFSGY